MASKRGIHRQGLLTREIGILPDYGEGHTLLDTTLEGEDEVVADTMWKIIVRVGQGDFDAHNQTVTPPHFKIGGTVLSSTAEILSRDIDAEGTATAPCQSDFTDAQTFIATIIDDEGLCAGGNSGDEGVEFHLTTTELQNGRAVGGEVIVGVAGSETN